MHIIHMRRIIPIIANTMLPKTPLPNPALIPPHPSRRAEFDLRLRAHEQRLYLLPTRRGGVEVALRQCPQAMHVIRQDNPGINKKRPPTSDLSHRMAQAFDLRNQRLGTTVSKVDGEEMSATRDMVSSIFQHPLLDDTPLHASIARCDDDVARADGVLLTRDTACC